MALVIFKVFVARVHWLFIARRVRLRLDRLVAHSPPVTLHRRYATLTDVAHIEDLVANLTWRVIGVRVVSRWLLLTMERALRLLQRCLI